MTCRTNDWGSPSPRVELEKISQGENVRLDSLEFAKLMDQRDALALYRDRFSYPLMSNLPHIRQNKLQVEEDAESIYLCGNSLGLKPKSADDYVRKQLEKWGNIGVEMHFTEPLPAASCDRYGRDSLGKLLGAKPECVCLMNGLSVNLNLLLLSFYQPTSERYKIVIENQAFPSDRYAVRSQAEIRGIDPETAIIEVKPRKGEKCIRTVDIIQVLENEGHTIAVVCLSGVQYYTGQKFDMETITRVAKSKGCFVGWDLAHAIGNVEIELDNWGVDFACWCTYKYLNSGPGCIAGAYVNSKHVDRDVPQLRGWWSNRDSNRFEMKDQCDVANGVDSFRMSNPPPILVACVLASLEVFDDAGMDRILEKQYLITGYLEFLLKHYFSDIRVEDRPLVTIITPGDPNQRGSQLSLEFGVELTQTHQELAKRGVVCDVRLPNVMRITPAPLYNSYQDVFKFCDHLRDIFSDYQ